MNEESAEKPVVDSNGNDFDSEVKNIYRSHGLAVDAQHEAEQNQEVVKRVSKAVSGALKGLGSDDRTRYIAGLAREGVESGLSVEKEIIADDIDAVAQIDEEALLHLSGNQEAYHQAAIQDANAAGHDITFNGENHPATPPKPQA